MTIETFNNKLRKKTNPIIDSFWNEILFSLDIWSPIILDDDEIALITKEFKYISGKYANVLRRKLQSQGFKIILDPNEYWSKYDGETKRITLWIKNHKDAGAGNYFHLANFNSNVEERYIIWAIFLHECSHHVLNECFSSTEIQQLNNLIEDHIITSNKTLTKLSKSYNWWDKIKEDITELIRMYIDSPDILKKHLNFLSTTWDIAKLNEDNLYRITPEEEDKIYSLIENLVQNYL